MSMSAMVTAAKSPKEVRRELKRLGFFHATGLPWLEAINDEEGQIQASRIGLGYWGFNSKWTAVVLVNGEVWLLKGEPSEECHNYLTRIPPLKSLPNGHRPVNLATIVPFFEDDHRIIDADHVADRVRDPYSCCNGYADPDPRPI